MIADLTSDGRRRSRPGRTRPVSAGRRRGSSPRRFGEPAGAVHRPQDDRRPRPGRERAGGGHLLGAGTLHLIFGLTPSQFSGPATMVTTTVPALAQLVSPLSLK